MMLHVSMVYKEVAKARKPPCLLFCMQVSSLFSFKNPESAKEMEHHFFDFMHSTD